MATNAPHTKRIILNGGQKPYLERNDVLKQYYSEISKFETLSKEETDKLFHTYRNGSEKQRKWAKDKIFKHNSKLVVSVARMLCSSKDNLSDLIEEGNIGLLAAMDLYDTENGASFQRFSIFYIRKYINLFKTNLSCSVKQSNRSKTTNVVTNIVNKFTQTNERQPTTTEIMDIYNTENPDSKINDPSDFINVEYVYVDNMSINNDDCESYSDFEKFVNTTSSFNDAEKRIDREIYMRQFHNMVDNLDDREKLIIRKMYGFDDGIQTSASVIAVTLNCCPERVRQIARGAIKKMKERVESRKKKK